MDKDIVEYDWLHFVSKHDLDGQFWTSEFKNRCGRILAQIRTALLLFRKHEINLGCEALAVVEAERCKQGEWPSSFSHVLDRWYYGVVSYYHYCSSNFGLAYQAVDEASRAVEKALAEESFLLPLAQTCHEFPLHKARIYYASGRWKEALMQIDLASKVIRNLMPLCILSGGREVYFSDLDKYFQEIPCLEAEEIRFLQKLTNTETRIANFTRLKESIYIAPVIPYY